MSQVIISVKTVTLELVVVYSFAELLTIVKLIKYQFPH